MNIFSWFTPVKRYFFAHKIISGILVVIVLGIGWYTYRAATNTSGQTRYILGTVQTGTIVASVSESGQVSTTNSVNIEPQTSGTITWVGVKAGDQVRAGQAIATIDNTTALQSLADAKRTLAADELQFQQSQAQAPISYQNDLSALSTAQENLQDDYNNTYNDLSGAYLDLPNVVSGAQDALYGYDFDPKRSQWNMDVLLNLFNALGVQQTSNVVSFETSAKSDYASANDDYTAAVAAYKATSRASDTATMDALLAQSITMTTAVAQALQSELNFYGAVSDLAQNNNVKLPSSFSTVQSSTRSYLST
ncbi:MAG: biotin/lipoyl-binding protein, partial [Chthoniobacterales bacterium]